LGKATLDILNVRVDFWRFGMTKRPIVEHLEAAMALAQYEGLPFVAYIIAMARAAADEQKKRSA
jgi:hypothetical protein